jgi:large subunit ribosomal protein L29
MKNKEIRQFTVEELKKAVLDQETRLHKLKFAHAITPLENPITLRTNRRLLARLITELHSRNA